MTEVKMPEPELFTHELIRNKGGVHIGIAEKGICEKAYVEGETSEVIQEWVLISTAKQYGDGRALEALEMAALKFETQHTWLTNASAANLIRALAKEIK